MSGGGDDAGLFFIDNGKPMGKIEGLSRRQERFQFRPHGLLARIGLEILDNRSARRSLQGRKEGLSGDESFIDRLLPVVVSFADDDIDPVVLHVQGLSPSLDAVTDDGDNFILEDFACLVQSKFFRRDHILDDPAYVQLCHNSLLFR